MRLAPSLHRLGEAIVSCYLLKEVGEITIIDAGVPATRELPSSVVSRAVKAPNGVCGSAS